MINCVIMPIQKGQAVKLKWGQPLSCGINYPHDNFLINNIYNTRISMCVYIREHCCQLQFFNLGVEAHGRAND